MANFPSTVPLRYPVSRGVRAASDVVQFLDGSEQRCRVGPVLQSLALRFSDVPKAHVDSIASWFAVQKGAYGSGSVALPTETLTSMVLESDECVITEGANGRYSVALNLRQQAQSGFWIDPFVFPALTTGALTQKPWSGKTRYLTTRNDLDGGARYARYQWAAGKRAWELTYSAISFTEAASLMHFFVMRGGKWASFSFDDPDSGTTYTVRFDMDEFQLQYVGPGQCAVTIQMVEC